MRSWGAVRPTENAELAGNKNEDSTQMLVTGCLWDFQKNEKETLRHVTTCAGRRLHRYRRCAAGTLCVGGVRECVTPPQGLPMAAILCFFESVPNLLVTFEVVRCASDTRHQNRVWGPLFVTVVFLADVVRFQMHPQGTKSTTLMPWKSGSAQQTE